jgi:hypothetical protein
MTVLVATAAFRRSARTADAGFVRSRRTGIGVRPSRQAFAGVLFVALTAAAGCSSRGNVDLLESKMRVQEDRLLTLEKELQYTQTELSLARKQSESYREQLAGRRAPVDAPEQADALFRASGLRISKLRTGGIDQDGIPGDDVLAASMAPVDAHGETVKVPGVIELSVIDPALPSNRQQIGHWKFSEEETPGLWHAGILGSGYQFNLPWQQVPRSGELWLHARMTTSDGRRFETKEQIRVTPPTDVAGDPGGELNEHANRDRRMRPAIPNPRAAMRATEHSKPSESTPDFDALRGKDTVPNFNSLRKGNEKPAEVTPDFDALRSEVRVTEELPPAPKEFPPAQIQLPSPAPEPPPPNWWAE